MSIKMEREDEFFQEKSDDERDRDRRNRRTDRQSRFSGQGDAGSGGGRDRSPRGGNNAGGGGGKKKSSRVFVSNIPYEYRWQELKDLFREKVGEVSFVELFVDENDKPRGCGIIEFANSDLAKEAVEKMHRYDLKGRKLVVKEDNDVERDKYGRIARGGGGGGGGGERNRHRDGDRDIPSLINGPSGSSGKFGNTYGLSTQFLESLNIQGPLVSRVFVANLDYNVDDKKLREVFRLAGRVISAEINTDKEGKSRGFGVVEYEHPVEAVQAISMLSNQMLYDRRLSVRMDRVGDKGDGLPTRLPEGLKGIGMGLGANGAPLQDVTRNLPNLQSPAPVGALGGALPNNALTAAALGGLAGQLGGVGGLVGAPANDITSLASSLVGNNSLAGANPLAAAQLLQSTGGGAGLGAFGNNAVARDFDSLSAALSGNAFASSRSLSDSRSLAPSASASDSILIKNLPPGTTWQMLRDKCRDAGDVKYAELRGKDTGIVQFASQWDAQRAINMLDGIRVDGRNLDVRFY